MIHRLFIATSVAAIAVLFTGCSGSQPPIGAPGAMPQTPAIAAHADRGRSWMLPEAKSASQLLYVTSYQTNDVSVLQLPHGKLVGTLTGFDAPSGECTDTKGDVFITDLEASQIWEYKHGAQSPKDILYDPDYAPLGCSVNPTTGDLAVSNEIKNFRHDRSRQHCHLRSCVRQAQALLRRNHLSVRFLFI